MRSAIRVTAAMAGMCYSLGAIACTCVAEAGSLTQRVETAVRQSDVVASIEVLSTAVVVTRNKVSGPTWSWTDENYADFSELVEEPRLVATFKILNVWKGSQSMTSVSTPTEWQACGLSFQVGEQLLLYATITDAGLSTGSCTRTSRLRSSQQEVKTLTRLKNQEPPNPSFKSDVAKATRP